MHRLGKGGAHFRRVGPRGGPERQAGSAARTASGNLVPKPMMFFPGDPLLHHALASAAACNVGESTAAELYAEDAGEDARRNHVNRQGRHRGGLKAASAEAKGLVRAELGQFRRLARLVLWRYAKGGETMTCAGAPEKVKGWVITSANHDSVPKLKQVSPAGLMPYDAAFMFNAKDCIRTKATAYTPDGGLAILYGQLAPKAASSRPPASARISKSIAGRNSSLKAHA